MLLILSLVSAEMRVLLLRLLDTVETETPAIRAISRAVTAIVPRFLRKRLRISVMVDPPPRSVNADFREIALGDL